MKETKIFICDCHSIEHQCKFYNVDNQIFITIHLQSGSFWKRLIYGIKYIFGYSSKFGEWDEFIFKNGDLNKLKQFLNENI